MSSVEELLDKAEKVLRKIYRREYQAAPKGVHAAYYAEKMALEVLNEIYLYRNDGQMPYGPRVDRTVTTKDRWGVDRVVGGHRGPATESNIRMFVSLKLKNQIDRMARYITEAAQHCLCDLLESDDDLPCGYCVAIDLQSNLLKEENAS